jgi:hypothetical protein
LFSGREVPGGRLHADVPAEERDDNAGRQEHGQSELSKAFPNVPPGINVIYDHDFWRCSPIFGDVRRFSAKNGDLHEKQFIL